jgi:hypothetical protein
LPCYPRRAIQVRRTTHHVTTCAGDCGSSPGSCCSRRLSRVMVPVSAGPSAYPAGFPILWCSWMLAWATAVPGGAGRPAGQYLGVCATAAFVDGRGSRLVAGGTPLGGAGAPAASGSRSWCRRRGCTAQRWRPPRRWWPSQRRATPRTAPAAPRSAGPGPGRARSPPNQAIEHKFEGASGRLRSPTGRSEPGCAAPGPQLSRAWGTARDNSGIKRIVVIWP